MAAVPVSCAPASLATVSPTQPPRLQEFSRQVSHTEGQAFATRMGALFVEASAKTAVGVQEAFRDVVERIMDTPELWQSSSGARKGGGASKSGGGGGRSEDMPGSIDLRQEPDEAEGGGCSC